MTNTIELENSFSEYALNELVKKLRELDPEQYDNYSKELDVTDLLDLLLEDEYTNGCYYLYTADSEQVFKTYFKDILYICTNYGYADGKPIDLDASNLVLVAMEHAFESLLQYFQSMIEVAELKFDRAGLDVIANTLLDMRQDKLEELINN